MAKCLICNEKFNDNVVEHYTERHEGKCGICGEIAITDFKGSMHSFIHNHHNNICCFCGGRVILTSSRIDSWDIRCIDCNYIYDED